MILNDRQNNFLEYFKLKIADVSNTNTARFYLTKGAVERKILLIEDLTDVLLNALVDISLTHSATDKDATALQAHFEQIFSDIINSKDPLKPYKSVKDNRYYSLALKNFEPIAKWKINNENCYALSYTTRSGAVLPKVYNGTKWLTKWQSDTEFLHYLKPEAIVRRVANTNDIPFTRLMSQGDIIVIDADNTAAVNYFDAKLKNLGIITKSYTGKKSNGKELSAHYYFKTDREIPRLTQKNFPKLEELGLKFDIMGNGGNFLVNEKPNKVWNNIDESVFLTQDIADALFEYKTSNFLYSYLHKPVQNLTKQELISDVYNAIINRENRVILAPAGSGKTTTLNSILTKFTKRNSDVEAEIVEGELFVIKPFTFNDQVGYVIKDKTLKGIYLPDNNQLIVITAPSYRALYEIKCDLGTISTYFEHCEVLLDTQFKVDNVTVIIDEAAMLQSDFDTSNCVLSNANLNYIVIGDTNQLGPVCASNYSFMHKLINDNVKIVRLNENYRNRRYFGRDLIDGQLYKVLSGRSTSNKIQVKLINDNSINEIVRDKFLLPDTLILSHTNVDVNKISLAYNELLTENTAICILPDITREGLNSLNYNTTFVKGSTVIFKKRYKTQDMSHHIDKNTKATILDIDDLRNFITLEYNDKHEHVNKTLKVSRTDIDYLQADAAVTIHNSQGITATGDVIVYLPNLAAITPQLLYTAVTRVKDGNNLTLYIDKKSSLEKLVEKFHQFDFPKKPYQTLREILSVESTAGRNALIKALFELPEFINAIKEYSIKTRLFEQLDLTISTEDNIADTINIDYFVDEITSNYDIIDALDELLDMQFKFKYRKLKHIVQDLRDATLTSTSLTTATIDIAFDIFKPIFIDYAKGWREYLIDSINANNDWGKIYDLVRYNTAEDPSFYNGCSLPKIYDLQVFKELDCLTNVQCEAKIISTIESIFGTSTTINNNSTALKRFRSDKGTHHKTRQSTLHDIELITPLLHLKNSEIATELGWSRYKVSRVKSKITSQNV